MGKGGAPATQGWKGRGPKQGVGGEGPEGLLLSLLSVNWGAKEMRNQRQVPGSAPRGPGE